MIYKFDFRVDSARTQRVENVIVDNAQHSDDDDDDEGFVVEEGAVDNTLPDREESVAPPTEDDGQHGKHSMVLIYIYGQQCSHFSREKYISFSCSG